MIKMEGCFYYLLPLPVGGKKSATVSSVSVAEQ